MHATLTITVYGLIGIVTIVFNVFEIYLIKKPKKKLKTYEQLLLSLATGDLLVGISSVVYSILSCFYERRKTRQIFIFMVIFTFTASLFNLFLIGIDRLIAVQFPLRHLIWVRRNKIVKAIIVIWVFMVIETGLFVVVVIIRPETLVHAREFYVTSMPRMIYFSCVLFIVLYVSIVYSVINIQRKAHKKNSGLNLGMGSTAKNNESKSGGSNISVAANGPDTLQSTSVKGAPRDGEKIISAQLAKIRSHDKTSETEMILEKGNAGIASDSKTLHAITVNQQVILSNPAAFKPERPNECPLPTVIPVNNYPSAEQPQSNRSPHALSAINSTIYSNTKQGYASSNSELTINETVGKVPVASHDSESSPRKESRFKKFWREREENCTFCNKQRALVYSCMLVVLSFIACTLPFAIEKTISINGTNLEALLIANSIVNPIIYFFKGILEGKRVSVIKGKVEGRRAGKKAHECQCLECQAEVGTHNIVSGHRVSEQGHTTSTSLKL